jgi:hypothetical protein
MSIIETIANAPDTGLSQAARGALLACVAKRGKGKGDLLRTCPKGYGVDAAAWLCLMLEANPYKANVSRMIFLSADAKTVYHELAAWIDAHPSVSWQFQNCDRDRRNLEQMGAW